MKVLRDKDYIKKLYYFLVCPVFSFFAMEWFLRNPFDGKWGMRPVMALINLIFFYILLFFLYPLTGGLRSALYILTVSAFFIGITDSYVFHFRGNTIVPWDLLSLSTALSVAGNYDFTPDKKTIILCILFILLWITIYFCDYSIKDKRRLRLALLISMPLFFFLAYLPFVRSDITIKKLKIYDKLFTPSTMTMRDGKAFAFLYDLKFLTVSKPDNYNKDSIRSALYRDYGGDDHKNPVIDTDTPNIIVIMCEAFSDPAVLAEFETNKDYMPFIRSLMDEDFNTVSGYLHVSVLGGNTPNTEFEFLTGNSMAFLPSGSIPFQQFINKKTDSLASYLGSIGYSTMAMHPYNKKGWDRNRVYPLLGFDEMYFMDYFKERSPKYVRKYISDDTLFTEIINKYKENGSETPFFSFNVTMQNHSEYSGDYDNFTPDIEIMGLDGERAIEKYLALEKLTDSAFRDLISYFDSVSDPTVVVFFGDHQPADHVVEVLWNMYGKTGKELITEEIRRRYEVPFVIWANYDINGASNVNISANYLGNLVLNAAGIELTGYRAFLEEQRLSVPVVTAVHTVKSDGSDSDSDIKDLALQDYRRFQYYEMFDDSDTLD